MDNRTKRKKPPDRGRVKIKPPDGLKAMPKEIALGALQDGTQKIASRLRDAGQRDERSDYGGERVEPAAADGTRLAARSAEAFLKSGAAALRHNKGEEPPPDDLPSDAPPQETVSEAEAAPVQDELPTAEPPALPECAESPALPEHPAPETAAELPSADKTALPEHPAVPETVTRTETPIAEEQSTEPEDKPSKRRSHRDEESASTERTEADSWRPAYKDVEPDALRRPVAVIVRKPGGATEPPEERDFPRARKPDRKVKTLAGRDAPPLLQGQGAREPAALPTAEQAPLAEYGRRKLIQERGRELAAKRTEIPLLEGNSGVEPLPLSEHGAEYHEPQIWEPPVTRTGETNASLSDAFPERMNIGDSRVTVRTKETPPLAGQQSADREIVKEREPLPSALRSGSASASGSGSGVAPNGADAETVSAPKAPQTGRVGVKTREASGYPTASTDADTATKTAAQGKQKAVRERAEQVAERQNAAPVKQKSVSISPETSVPPPKQSAVSVKTKAAYAKNETPSAEPESQSAAQGKNKLVRERMEQAAGQRADTVAAERNPAAASVKTSASTPEQSPVPVKTKEALQQEAPQNAPRVKERAILERTDDVPAQRESAPIRKQSSVKTKEAYPGQDAPLANPQGVAAGRQKALQDSAGRIAERRTESGVSGQESAVATDPPKQNAASFKTKETYAQRETPPADFSRPEVLETPRTPVKTKEAYIQSGGTTATRMPVKTKEAYAQTGSASKFTESESAALRRDASPRINGEKPSVKTKTTTAPHVAETPPPFDKTQPLRQQATVTVKTKDADIPRPRPLRQTTRRGKLAKKSRLKPERR